jgi:hypothetical protein
MSDPGFVADVMAHGPEEAKHLLRRLGLYTHVGYRRQVGHVHTGRLYGHADYRGKSHALGGGANIYSGAVYTALCGETVVADDDGYSLNVRPAPDENGKEVGCKRCLARIRRAANG